MSGVLPPESIGRHLLGRFEDWGWFGVDLFLVLSAYLITSLLLLEHTARGAISLRRFYARRLLRIWPLYYLVATIGFFVFPALQFEAPPWLSPEHIALLEDHLVPYYTLFGNFSVGLHGYPTVVTLRHLWTVTLEEQFYIVWPLVLSVLLRWHRTAMIWGVLGGLLLPAFRRAEIYHFRPHFRDNQPAGPTVTSPHAEPARPPMVSTLKLIFLLTVFTIGYWIRIRPKLVRTTLVIFDRYYHDLLVDPRRYRFKHPLWLARILGRFIPTPDLWLVLDASAETLHSRKQEVPFLESARQRLAYADLGKRLANSHIVDASAPMEKVAGQCVSTILQHMAWRQQIRYRLLR
jgi:hypothetical protein